MVMNIKTMSIVGVAAVIFAVFIVFASGCVSQGEKTETITLVGSTTVLPIAQTVA